MKPAGKKDVLFNAFNDHELLFIVNCGCSCIVGAFSVIKDGLGIGFDSFLRFVNGDCEFWILENSSSHRQQGQHEMEIRTLRSGRIFLSFRINASKRPGMPRLKIWSLLLEILSTNHSPKTSSLKPISPVRLVDWEKSTTTWWPSIVQLS